MKRCQSCQEALRPRQRFWCTECAKTKHREQSVAKCYQQLVENARRRLQSAAREGLYYSIIEDGVLEALWSLGVCPREIGKFLGRSPQGVARRARRLGLRSKPRIWGRPVSAARCELVRELWEAGASFAVMRERVGMSAYRIKDVARELGLAPREGRNLRQRGHDVREMRQLAMAGLSRRQIALRLGTTKGAVVGALWRAGKSTAGSASV